MKKQGFFKKVLRKSTALALSCTMLAGLAHVPSFDAFVEAKAAENFNYGEALQKSLIFYELQKSGELDGEEFNRNNWRGDSCLKDGQDNGVDLTGGWFDAGDNAKFNLPMSYTATMLAWSYLQNTNAYKESGQEKYLLNELEWVNDYFVKCHPEDNVYYYQVGSGNADHAFWGSAEIVEVKMDRPSYKVDNTEANGGSAVCGQTAAALATASMALQNTDSAKAATYLKHAKELYKMAEDAKSDAGYTEANGFYNSWSGYNDELSWAAYWIYKATGDASYLDKAQSYAKLFGSESQGSSEVKYSYTHCWDDAHLGASLVLATCDEVDAANREKYLTTVENNMKFWLGDLKGKGSDQVEYTEGGLAWMSQWGSIRYATTAAYLATVYAKWDGADDKLAQRCWDFAKQQADYALGSTGQSFQIGYGENYPQNPHHRTAHGAWGDSLKTDPDETRHVLVGALVGGPQSADDSSYEDDRGNYYSNEVACDYNAGFTGLLAAMYEEYDGTIDASVNAVEEVGKEFYIDAAINAENSTDVQNFVEFKTVIHNQTAWPARLTDNLKMRIYVDVDDADVSKFTVQSNYSQSGAEPSQLKAYDKENGIYYTELDLSGVEIYPGGQLQHRSETQIRISANGKWDYSNSPSLKGLEGTSNNEMVESAYITLYEGDKLVSGQEPDGTTPEDTTQAATTQTPATTQQASTTAAAVTTEQAPTTAAAVTTEHAPTTAAAVTTEQASTTVAAATTQKTPTTAAAATTQTPAKEPELRDDEVIIDSFDDEDHGWKLEKQYKYATDIGYDKSKKALKVSLDYSSDPTSYWLEGQISKEYDKAIDISGKKYIGYTITYPSALDGGLKSKIIGENVTTSGNSSVFTAEATLHTACKTYDKATDLYTVLVYVPIEKASGSECNKLLISLCGSQTSFKGDVTIDNVELFDTLPEYVAPEEGLIYLLDNFSKYKAGSNGEVNNWKPLTGWQYSAGKASSSGQEPTTISYDEERKALKVDLDYSADSDKSWSEAKINTWMDQNGIDISKTNQLRFDVTYPKEFDGFGVKIFANNYAINSNEALIEAEASIKEKDKVDNGDGTITATVKVGYMKGIETPLNSICIGFVGKYTDFKGSIYVDNAEIWAVNVGVALPSVETPGTKVDISNMPAEVKMADASATKEAAAAFSYLQGSVADGKVLFGHQNDNSRTVSGGASDTKDITGSYSALIAYDSLALSGSELGVSTSEGTATILKAAKEAAKEGALISLCTHMPNFATMKAEGSSDFSAYGFESSKDLSGNCAENILPGKSCNDLYNRYLDMIAQFALDLQKEGIPVIFRPLHENNGGWFWWGSSCSAETYKALYRYTVDYLQSKGVHNFIYEYSPNGPIMTEEQFLSRYPGDDYVDILAFDYYDDYAEGATQLNETFFDNLQTSCEVIKGLAEVRGKVAAIAEAGVRVTKASGDSNGLLEEENPITGKGWYNKVNEVCAETGMSYFMLWANFSNQNFYVPYLVDVGKCQELGPDFVDFYNSDTSVFADGTNLTEALTKSIDVVGYTDVSGYMVDPVNFQEVVKPTTFTASVKNAEKVEYVITPITAAATVVETAPVRVEAVKNASGMYEADITSEVLEQIGKVEIANVALVGDGVVIANANYVSFGTTKSKAPEGTIDNFDYYYGDKDYLDSKYCGSNSSGGSSSSISLSKKGAKDGTYAGRFTYFLTHSGSESWTGVGRALEVTDYAKDSEGNTTNAISLWVTPDGKGQKFVLQLVSNGFEFEAFLTDFMKGTKAQYVTIPFSALKPKVSGKVFDPSNVTQMYFYCNSIFGSEPYEVESSIYIDKIKAIKADESKIADVPAGGYVTSDVQLDGETDEEREVVAVTGVSVKETVAVTEGDSIYVRANVEPEEASNTDVEWESKDESIVTVNASGKITGVKPGTATIVVKTVDGGFTASCEVTVIKRKVDLTTTETPADDKTETPADDKTETPADDKTETPADDKTETPADDKTETPADDKTETPADDKTEAPADDKTETPADDKTEAPADDKTEAPADDKTETPADDKTETPAEDVIAVKEVKLNTTKWSTKVGEKLSLKATILPENASNKALKWETTDEKVAMVDDKGNVTAVGVGTATISVVALDSGVFATCKVEVSKEEPSEVLVTSISLDKATYSMQPGEKVALTPTILPSNATNTKVEWIVDKEDVLAVDQDGVVTALSEGTATVAVIAKDGSNKKATCLITVETKEEDIAVSKITMVQGSAELPVGEELQLMYLISPSNASNQNVTWSSSDESVLIVDDNGKITALSEGHADITVTTQDGSKTATCKVTVVAEQEEIVVKDITLDCDSWTMKPGESKTLNAVISPDNAANQTLEWKSSDTSVVEVDKNGKMTAFAEGKATITVTTANGKVAYCNVIVTAENDTIAVESVTLDPSYVTLSVGKSVDLTVHVTPEDATNKAVIFNSDIPDIATVTDKGTVTAVAEGTAVITVTTKDGLKIANCTVIVTGDEDKDTVIAVEDVILSTNKMDLTVGDERALTATVSPFTATNKNVTWKSSDEKVAQVDEKGNVKAIAQGTATITVYTEDGHFSDSCDVTVTKKNTTTEDKDDDKKPSQDTTTENNNDDKKPSQDATTENSNDNKKPSQDAATENNNSNASPNTTTQANNASTNQNNSTTQANTIPVTSIELMEEMFSLSVGKTATISPVVMPYNATDKNITYVSSDVTVATVSADGVITAVKPGVAQITITAGGKTVTCQVLVKPGKVKSLKKKNVTSNKVTLSWKKVTGATGYKVYKYDKKAKKYKLYKTVKSTKLTVKKLAKGTSYKFKVRAYKKAGAGTMYGSYSKVLTVKTKK